MVLNIYKLTKDFPDVERYGSCAELETQLSLSKDLGFVSEKEKFENIYILQEEVSKMLGAIICKIKNGENK